MPENNTEPIPEKPPVIEHHLSIIWEGTDLWIPIITIVPIQTAHTEVEPDTVQHWLEQASKYMEIVSRYMLCDLHLTQVQVDELWALMGKREKKNKHNASWVWVASDPVSKLFLAFVVGDRSLQMAQLLIHSIVCVLSLGCMPLFMSDQWSA